MVIANETSARVYPGIVVAAVIVAVTGAVAAALAPALGLLLGAAGVWLSLRSRRTLRDDAALSGWGLSLAAMIVSSATVAFGALLLLAPPLLSVVFLLTGGVVD